MEKITVILTSYNSEETISRAVESIFKQKGYNEKFKIEIIAVDDCSTDQTVKLLNKFPLYVYSTDQNTGGPNRGRNIGLDKATGDWISLMDHDDTWHPNRIMSVLPYLKQAPIISSGYTAMDYTRNQVRLVLPKRKNLGIEFNLYAPNQTFLDKLKRSKEGQETYLGSLIFSKNLKTNLFEETYGQVDYDWVLRLFENQSSLELCKSLFDRNVWNKNLSLNEKYRINDFNHSVQFITENCLHRYPAESKMGIKRINGSMGRYYYRMEKMKQARKYFSQSRLTLKTVLYYLSSFWGYKWVNKKFNVFG